MLLFSKTSIFSMKRRRRRRRRRGRRRRPVELEDK